MTLEVLTIATDFGAIHTRTTRTVAQGGTVINKSMDGIATASVIIEVATGHGIAAQQVIVIRENAAPFTVHFEGMIETIEMTRINASLLRLSLTCVSMLSVMRDTAARPQVFESASDRDIILGVMSESTSGVSDGVYNLGNFFRKVTANSTNVLTQSEDLSDASYTKTRCSITANDLAAPDGATTADKIVEDGTAASTHFIEVSLASTTDDTLQACSCFVRPDERDHVRLEILDKAGSTWWVEYDLTDGSKFADSTGVGLFARDVGGGWYRCFIIRDIGSGGTSPVFRVYAHNGTSITYSGDSASGLHVWGMQHELDTVYDGPYAATSGASASVTNIQEVLASTDYAVGEGSSVLDVALDVAKRAGAHLYEQGTQLYYTDQPGASAALFNLRDDFSHGSDKPFQQLIVREDSQNLENTVTVIGGRGSDGLILVSTGSDATSVTTYGTRVNPQGHYRYPAVTTQAALDDIRDAIIALKKDPIDSATCIVYDDGLEVNRTVAVTGTVEGLSAKSYLLSAINMEVLNPTTHRYGLTLGPVNRRHRLMLETLLAAGFSGALPVANLGVRFNGSNEYISFAGADVPATMDDLKDSGLSISFWFSPDTVGVGDQTIIDKQNGWRVRLTTNDVELLVSVSSGSTETWACDDQVVAGKVQHVFISWNGGTGSGDCTITVNGGGTTTHGGSGTPVAEGNTGINVGRKITGGTGNYFAGWISDLCIWAAQTGVNDRGTIFSTPDGSATGGVKPSEQLARLRLDDDVDGATCGAGEVKDSWGSMEDGDGINTPVYDEQTYFPLA